jgi:hypothetical protein
MRDQQPDFPSFSRSVKQRYETALAKGTGTRPEPPFCIDAGNGMVFDAMQQVRGTLAGLLTILLAIAAGITAIFTLGVVLWVLLVIMAITLGRWLLHSATSRKLGRNWLQDARPFPAALVMGHNSVLEPGNSIVPGTMLVDFGTTPDPERLQAAAQACFALAKEEEVPAHHRPLRDWLRTEMQRARFRRIQVPKDLVGNDNCWLVSFRFDRKSMPSGYIDRPIWFVLARPQRDESAELLPHEYWVAAG